MNTVPIAELVLDELDAVSGLDQLEACLPWLEKVYVSRQKEGGAANFPPRSVGMDRCRWWWRCKPPADCRGRNPARRDYLSLRRLG